MKKLRKFNDKLKTKLREDESERHSIVMRGEETISHYSRKSCHQFEGGTDRGGQQSARHELE